MRKGLLTKVSAALILFSDYIDPRPIIYRSNAYKDPGNQHRDEPRP